jgi:hypothetical protein
MQALTGRVAEPLADLVASQSPDDARGVIDLRRRVGQ